ncbi:hypothetical protein FRC12_006045 [Ceratobasidium sp. 428]|nr:hypothetical protein FRC12_006045 [Ceratobasidium sp. 428]
MHSESGDPDVGHLLGSKNTATRATPSPKTNKFAKELAPPYIRQGVDIDASDESLPLSDLSNSPSPATGRRLSLLSDASINASGPLTPTKRLFADVAVNDSSDRPLEYKRIQSTPYPKSRLPTQLTPHPQARIVSLPEWSRNRNPFLESLRNPRSVSSPVRLKPAPLSPIYHEIDEEVENSFESSEYSSGSLAQPLRFPTLPDVSEEPFKSYQSNPAYISKEHLYAAPHGLFFTPPSHQSLVLSPPTTGLDRPLPRDRTAALLPQEGVLPPSRDSEDEVSLILQQMNLDASSLPNRSSVAASTASRVSSPESVVFLSSMTKIPRTFLGVRRTPGGSALPTSPIIHEQTDHPHSGSHDDERASHCLLLEKSEPGISQNAYSSMLNEDMSLGAALPIIESMSDEGWIMFDEPPKPIPALHGPASLPYARCPSGAEGVVLDNLQPADNLVWGLAETVGATSTVGTSRAASLPKPREIAQGSEANHQAPNYASSSNTNSTQLKVSSAEAASVPHSQSSSTLDKYEAPSPARLADSTRKISAAHHNTGEKHVRFLDVQADNTPQATTVEGILGAGSQGVLAGDGADTGNTSIFKPGNLALVLQEQLERARTNELRALERAKLSTRQETLDQLRRFGVPFRPHVASNPAPTDLHPPGARFQFVKKSGSLADLLATSPSNQERPSARYDVRASQLLSHPVGSNVYLPSDQSSMEPRSVNAALDSLANVKSIPLLKLRERQHAEYQIRGGHNSLAPKVSGGHPRSPHGQGDVPDSKQSRSRSHSLSLSSKQPTSSQMAPTSKDLPTSVRADQALSSGTLDRSPRRRRPRKSGKRAPPNNPADLSESPQKENQRAPKESDASPHKPKPLHAGRKRSVQRSRSDSLPQAASRNG